MSSNPKSVGRVSPLGRNPTDRSQVSALGHEDAGLRCANPTYGTDWAKTTLGGILTLQRGMDLPVQNRKSGLVPIVASTGVVGFHSEAPVKGPGVVIGRSGSIGGGQYVDCDFWPLNTTLWIKDFKGNDVRFCYYLLRSIDFSGLNAGSGVPTLNRNHLHPMPMLRPPVSEQKQIAALLGALDDRITLLRETNATLEAIAQVLFKSWFVDFDPVHAKQQGRAPEGMDEATAALFPDSFEESELGFVPKGWKICIVGDITQQIFSGGTPDTRKSEYWIGQIPWFSSGETRERFVIDTEKKINLEAIRNSSTKLALPGDILIASAGQGHTRGQTSFCAIETYINQSVVSVRTDIKKCHPIWLFYNLSRRYDEMRNISDSHSSRGSLTTKLLAGMRVALPEYKLIKVFADTMMELIDSQIHNSKRIAILTDLRDTLLPRLISGQLRLPEAEALLEKTCP